MDTNSVKNLIGEPASTPITDIPIEHLDYDYIGECSKVKELEKILKVLRSGQEGYYPDLIQFCEERIAKLNPNSRVLRKDKAPASKYDMASEEWSNVKADIKDWTNDISQSDKALNSKQSGQGKMPPVRKGTTIDTHGKKQKKDTDEVWGKPSKDRIKSSDYRQWDKYDVDAEASKIDGVEDKGQRLKEAATEISSSRSAGKTSDVINVDGMSDRDREMIANREKDKGNEAFRSSDFEEAVTYYSRSISVIPSAPAYNNRALARIKLGHFQKASDDCTKVLELEPDNIKAYLRRGTSRKSLKEYGLARLDLEKVLSIEPHNKQAKDLLADLKAKESKSKKDQENRKKDKPSHPQTPSSPIAKGGRRLVIEEVEGSDESDEEWADAEQDVDRGSNLVNGVMNHGSKPVEDEEKFASPVAGSKGVPNGDSEVIQNIPFDERSTDVTDGGCVSRPAQDKVSSNKENGLNEAAEKMGMSGEVTNADRGQHTTEPASNPTPPPPAPRKEQPLPQAVVSMKDKALELYKAGQYSEARDGFTQAIDRLLPDKEDFGSALVSLYSNRASCNHRIGDSESCVRDCDASLELNPYNAKVLVKRASAYEAKEKYRNAYVDYQQALSMDPVNNVAQAGSARLVRLLREEDGSNWRERLPPSSTIPNLPKRPPIITTMAPSNTATCASTSTTKATMTTMNAGQQSQAKGQQVKGQQNKGQKVKSQDSSLQDVGQPDKGQQVKGQQDKDSQNVKTEPQKDSGKEKKKAEPVLTKEERFQKLKNEGNAFFKKGVHNEAVRCYTACIDTDPTQVASYTNRALCFLKLNQFKKAEVDCSLALALEKNNIKALYRRALANKGLKEYKKSLQDFTALLKVDPENKDAKKELDLVKDLWRKELMAAKSTAKSSEKSQTKSKPTRIQIEEEDDSDEKEDSDKTSIGNKSNKKTSNKTDKPTPTKDNQESTKQAGSKKTSRNSQSKPAANTVPKLSKISAYEFMQAWMSLKGSKNLGGYAEIIKQVPPKDLPNVLTNKLDGDMLGLIVRATSEVLTEKDPGLGYAVLRHLVDVDRFNTLALFLSGKDKKSLRRALDHLESVKCEAYTADDVKKLRKNYSL